MDCVYTRRCGQQLARGSQLHTSGIQLWHLQCKLRSDLGIGGAASFCNLITSWAPGDNKCSFLHNSCARGWIRRTLLGGGRDVAASKGETLRAKPTSGSPGVLCCIAVSAESRGELYLTACGGHDVCPYSYAVLGVLVHLSPLGKLSFPRHWPVQPLGGVQRSSEPQKMRAAARILRLHWCTVPSM